MSWDVQIVHSVQEIGQVAWDRLSQGRPFASYRWYAYGEKVMAYAKPHYVTLSQQGEPVARATFWLSDRELMPLESRQMNSVLQFLLRRWPLLICQSPISSAAISGLILPEPPLRDVALELLAQTAQELLDQLKGSFAVFSYLEEDETRLPGWPEGFVVGTTPGPTTQMTISWTDFDDYLADMSKKRRYNIRRTMRLAVEEGIQIKTSPRVTDVDRAMELHLQVNRHHGASTEPWMRGALEHAHMVDAIWLTAERDGCIVGCELMLGDGSAWFVTGLGLDYGVKNVYFALGYADIRCAIERGARELRWGSMTYEVKERLGFEQESNNHDVFFGRGLFHELGRWVADRWT